MLDTISCTKIGRVVRECVKKCSRITGCVRASLSVAKMRAKFGAVLTCARVDTINYCRFGAIQIGARRRTVYCYRRSYVSVCGVCLCMRLFGIRRNVEIGVRWGVSCDIDTFLFGSAMFQILWNTRCEVQTCWLFLFCSTTRRIGNSGHVQT